MKRKIVISIVLTLVISTLSMIPSSTAHTEDDPYPVILYAGQDIPVGTVYLWNDVDYLYVKYETDDPWLIAEIHLDVAAAMSEIPQKNGNPIPGKFEINMEYDPCVPGDTFQFDLDANGFVKGDFIYIAAHAVVLKIIDGEVVQEETAWGDGEDFPGKNWATCITYTIQGWTLVDTLIVYSQLDDHTDTSNFNTEVGETYLFKAYGVYTYCIPDGRWADAEFVWRTLPGGGGYLEDDALHFVCLNDLSLNLGDIYQEDHIYYAYFIGDGDPVTFEIWDTYYPDNVGYLTLEIYEWA